MSTRPVAIAIGGPPGAGKTTLATRLAADLGIPTLSSDAIGRVIKGSEGARGEAINAYWIAYDVIFGLCDEFLRSGVSAILDLNLGWEFQWRQLDRLRADHPEAQILPVVLRCPREICLTRIQARHDDARAEWAPPEHYRANEAIVGVWDYLERLNRPDARFVDAGRSRDAVYADVQGYVVTRLGTNGCDRDRVTPLYREGIR